MAEEPPAPRRLPPPQIAIFAEGGPGTGIWATSQSESGVLATSQSGTGVTASSQSNAGVVGYSSSGQGVSASSQSNAGVAASSQSGTGVLAISITGIGLHAIGGGAPFATPPAPQIAIFAEGGPGTGIWATSQSGTGVSAFSDSGTAVSGQQTNPAGNDQNAGVFGSSLAVDGNGVIGEANNGSVAYGVWGRSTSGYAGYFDGNVQVNGSCTVTGTKNFVQAHPTDPSREILYVALEGGEAGTYMRGTGQLVNGKAVIALPEHFALVTDHQDLTIQLTPRGTWLQLYVVELDTAQFVVRKAQGQSGAFDYLIHGIRRGYAQHEAIRTKRP